MADAGLKIVIGADISAVTDGMKVASSNVAQFGDAAEKAFSEVSAKVGVAANAFEHAFDEIAAGNAALAKINASIDAAGDAAIKAGAKFDTLGGRLPLQDFNQFKSTVDKFKKDIESGFKFKFTGGSIIPPIPPGVPESFKNTAVGANQAGLALSNVGRIAQDLPFGFIGIQNNLNPLLESFQRLKAETGSSKAALSALGSSLIGAGGIGLALSVVSSAFLIYQNGIAGFNKKTKEAADKAKEAADKLKEFLGSLKSVAEVTDTATAGQAGNIAQVQALANVVRDTTSSYNERKRALQDLQQVNKSYFGDLKLEENQMALLTDRVNEYSKAIIAQAVLKGFTDEISRVSLELSNQDRALKKTSEQLGRAKKALDATGLNDVTSRQGTVEATKNYIALQQEIKKLEPVYNAQREVVEQLQTNYALLNGEIDEATRNTLKLRDLNAPGKQKAESDGLNKQLSLLEKIRDTQKDFQGKLFDLKDIDEATDKLAALEQQVGNLKLKIALRDAKKAGLPASEIAALQDAIKLDTEKRLNEAFEKEALLLELPKLKFSQINRLDIEDIASRVFTSKEKIKIVLGENGIDVSVKEESVDITDLQGKIAKATGLDKKIPVITLHEVRLSILGVKLTKSIEIKEALQKSLGENVTQVLNDTLTNAFSNIGESLGKAIAGGGIGDVFTSLFDILASGLQAFGKALLAYGVALLGFKIAMKTINPVVAIVAGVAAIAAGAAVKASLPKFAEGGIVSGPTIGQIGERFRPEVVLPLDRLPQLFKQFGGDTGGGTQLIPIINNEGLYLAMKRGERSAGRNF
jgi:hypothetical protein